MALIPIDWKGNPVQEIIDVVDEFREWAAGNLHPCGIFEINIESLGCPHFPTPLLAGWQGIYCFRYRDAWLKIGKAGPKSAARWISQHYNPLSAPSTLAFSLIRYGHSATIEEDRVRGLKAELIRVHPQDIGSWIKKNTERTNIVIRAELGKQALDRLEKIAHWLLYPIFEGTWKFGGSLDCDSL